MLLLQETVSIILDAKIAMLDFTRQTFVINNVEE